MPVLSSISQKGGRKKEEERARERGKVPACLYPTPPVSNLCLGPAASGNLELVLSTRFLTHVVRILRIRNIPPRKLKWFYQRALEYVMRASVL